MIVYLKNNNFDELINDSLVIVDFYATWCGPCKMQDQVMEKINDKVKIIKVDVDKHMDIAKRYGIMSIPTILIFKNNELKKTLVGFTPLSLLEEEIKN